MKLDFQDTLKRDAIGLTFKIKGDDIERDIYTDKANIKWSLKVESRNWGIDGFSYELIELQMPITIDAVLEDGKIECTTVQVEIKFNSSLKYICYVCRMYEDVLEDNEWKEVIFSSFPININIEEAASTEDNKRTQIFIKYLNILILKIF